MAEPDDYHYVIDDDTEGVCDLYDDDDDDISTMSCV
jgi:hypothetical protein